MLHIISPGYGMQNAFVESTNNRFRGNCLNQYAFQDMHEAILVVAVQFDQVALGMAKRLSSLDSVH